MTMIEISSTEWTIEDMRAAWADDDTLTSAQVTACADAQYAHLVITIGERLRGWSYTDGAFTGPARTDAISKIMELMQESTDYVLSQYDDIKREH